MARKVKLELTARTFSDKAQAITIDIGHAFELPPGAARKYKAHSAWAADAAQPAIELEAGKPYSFELAPFEVLTLDAVKE